MPSRSRYAARLFRLVGAVLCLGGLVVAAGCRKSARDIAEEQRKAREDLMEREWRFQQAEARARNLFYQGKEMARLGRYKEAVEAWDTAMAADERVDLMVDLAKNLMAAEMLDKAHYLMHRARFDPSRAILELLVDKNSAFMEKHVKKGHAKLDEWEWIKGGWEKFSRATKMIETHQLAPGLDLLENIAKNYPRTPLADEAMKLLRQYGR